MVTVNLHKEWPGKAPPVLITDFVTLKKKTKKKTKSSGNTDLNLFIYVFVLALYLGKSFKDKLLPGFSNRGAFRCLHHVL